MFKLCPLDKSLKIISTTPLLSCQTTRFSLSHNISVFHLFQENCQHSFFTLSKLHTFCIIKNQQVLRNPHLTLFKPPNAAIDQPSNHSPLNETPLHTILQDEIIPASNPPKSSKPKTFKKPTRRSQRMGKGSSSKPTTSL